MSSETEPRITQLPVHQPPDIALSALAGRRLDWAQPTYGQALLLVTGVALAIRGLFLGLTPLWADEAFMGVLMRRSLGAMIDVVHYDNHPPLQYLLDRGVTVFRDSPEALRLSSVLAGVAAVPLAAALGRRIGGDRAGITSGLLAAVMPLMVVWSRDARMYALATTMVLAMALALWRALERASPGRLAAYVAVVVVALYTHYLVVLAIPAQFAAAALFLRPSRAAMTRALVAAAAAGAALVPWLLYAAPQFRHAGEPYWIPPLSVGSIAAWIENLTVHPGPTTLYFVASVAGLALGVTVVVLAYRGAAAPERRAMLFLLGCACFALATLLVISLKKPLVAERFANLYVGEVVPVAGAALARATPRWFIGAVMALLAAVSVVGMTTLKTPDIPGAVATIAGRVDPAQDVVAVNGPYDYFQVLYYGDASTRAATRVVAGTVPWYYGLAGFRPGDLMATVPDPVGTLYLVSDPGQGRPTMPGDLHLARRQCTYGACVETWTH